MSAAHQGPRRHAACKIVVHGMQDVTSKLNPYLLTVQVTSTVEGAASKCHIELDDREGRLAIPPDGVAIFVSLGWAGEGPRVPDGGRTRMLAGDLAVAERTEMPWSGPGLREVFAGQVSSVESGFGRKGGGRRLWIEATSSNVKGLGKELLTKTWGDGSPTADPKAAPDIPFGIPFAEVFASIGCKIVISPLMATKMAKHWSINNESPMAFGERMARELGGIFSLDNNIASMVGRFEGMNALGEMMPTTDAVWGVNLIGWRIKPYVGRPQYAKAAARYFDLNEGKWNIIQASIPGTGFYGSATAVAHAVMPVADQTTAENLNTGTAATSMSHRGTGWVLLNGEPEMKGGAYVKILGARDGIDGRYLITEAEHNYTRGVGFTTRCNVQYPTPMYGEGGWPGDPGKFDPDNPPANHSDPKAPNYTPPDAPKPGEKPFTDEQKEGFRKWYRDNQKPYPTWLIPPNANRR